MPKLLMPQDQPQRTTITVLVALIVLFLLGSPAGSAVAQEDATGGQTSEQTVIQESTSAEGTSGDDASGRSAQTSGVKVGGGEAVAGDAYAGNGCAKAGDVTAGNCDEKGTQNGGSQDARPGNGGSDNGTADEAAPRFLEIHLLQAPTRAFAAKRRSRRASRQGQEVSGPPKLHQDR